MLFELKEVFLNDDSQKQIEFSLDMSKIDIDGVFPFKTPVKITALAKNEASLVILTLDTWFDYTRNCDRCCEEFTRKINNKFTHNLVTNLEGDQNDDYIETPDFNLELDDIVISDILLSLPSKNLCKEDCKGLCPSCGKNLNNGDCSCSTKQIDSRLEILKQLID